MSSLSQHARRRVSATKIAAATGAAATLFAADALGLGGVANAAGDPFAQIRQCESGGNYSINTGNGYYGAYQFSLATWQSLGYSGLPSSASPAVQDEAARRLQAASGWGQWPVCGRGLGGVSVAPSSPRVAAAHRPAAVSAPALAAGVPAFSGTLLTLDLRGQGPREDVRAWQARMADRGWPIAVDGVYGPQSAAICTAFETEKGLGVETPGEVGPQVWAATWQVPVT